MKKLAVIALYFFAASGLILTVGFLAVKFGLTNETGIIDEQRSSFLKEKPRTALVWTKGEEWSVIKKAVARDRETLDRAAAAAGVPPRLIVAELAVEQLRLFHDNRELFKTVFAPLKILGNQSQFSWGVMGIKQETAVLIEENLKDSNSPFYPGPEYELLLDFKTGDRDRERFLRIIDEHDRFYSYLYAALFLKEILAQWQKTGYDISGRPEILSTLYDIGFARSKPNGAPKSGGAPIKIGDMTYSFGSLAGEFYDSDELIDYFPR